ncbi:MAG: TlpA family protein disulfide reductase [Rhizobiales bacterium]|nr:TlpA family protein disulfide reductase [Hyphomicrobiales bacterium]
MSAFATPGFAQGAELAPRRDGNLKSFTLASLDGTRTGLNAQRGRIVLVHFFATWCEPCREELPALNRLIARASPGQLSVVGIAVAEGALRVRRFLTATPVHFPVLLDEDRATAKAWKIMSLPSTVILDESLRPKLSVASDYAWDRIDPARLPGMLAAATKTRTSREKGRK